MEARQGARLAQRGSMQRTTARPGHAGGRTFRVQMRRRSILPAEDQALPSHRLLLYEDWKRGINTEGLPLPVTLAES